jgi:phosphatidylinositol alpha-mannosyltransferase
VRHVLSRHWLPDDGVDLLGVLPSADLDRELARAKLLIAPSLGRESFGMVLTRAFAAATPVVASDIDGYRQLVEPDAGLLVPPGDHLALERAIVSLLTDESKRRRFGRMARERAVARYAWPQLAQQLCGIYERLLDSSRGARSRPRRGCPCTTR